jgi:hypothetical protein
MRTICLFLYESILSLSLSLTLSLSLSFQNSHIPHSQEGFSYNGSPQNENGCGPKVVPKKNSACCQQSLSSMIDLSFLHVFLS